MNGIYPKNTLSKNNSNTFNEGIQSQLINGNDSSIIKQPPIINQSIISPTNEFVFQNRASKLLTRSEILNDYDQNGKSKQIELDQTLAAGSSQNKQSGLMLESKLLRKSCNIKDEKTGLAFSTLYVAKFIRRIKAVSSLMRFKEMIQPQFKIIEDPSSDYNYYFIKGSFIGEPPSAFDKFYHKFQTSYSWKKFQNSYVSLIKLDQIRVLILPNSLSRLIWITFLFFILLMNLIYIPVKYSFDLSDYGEYKWFVFYLPQFAFIFEIVLTFFTAFYMIGLYHNFYFDLVIVFRIYDIFSILREIDERFQFRGKVANVMELFKLIFFIIMFAHIIACSWHKIGILGEERGEKVTWMTSIKNDAIPDSQYDYYITSLYWAVVTMITLGYGDIVPKNSEEKLFVIFITQVSCILFAYTMNSIGEILKEMGRKKLIFKHQMGLIDTYMRKRGLNQLTQVKVRKYFEYLNKESLEDNEQSSKLISNLPQTLKEEVYSDVYGRVLNQKKIFHLHFSPPFLKELSLQMRERRLGPEEVLFKEYEGSDSIYIVMKGKENVQSFQKVVKINLRKYERNNHILKTLVKGDLFGEIQFFSGQLSEYTAVTANVTSLAVLKKKDFLSVIQRFPKDHEQYCYMKDSINLCFNIEGLDHKCVSCGSYTHTIKNCQYVNFVRSKQKVLNLYTKQFDQKRFNCRRKRQKKGQKAILNQKQVYDSVVKSIFVASKTAKTQDLQEELSDMDSDLSPSYTNNSFDVENDDAEMSRAALSMISSISPQFTQDFFQRTQFQRYQLRKASTKIIKASKFAKYNKDDDFNIKIETNSHQDKSQNDESREMSHSQEIKTNMDQIEPKVTLIKSKANQNLSPKIQDNKTNKKMEFSTELKSENDQDKIPINYETDHIKDEVFSGSENINNYQNQGIFSTDENLLTNTPLKSLLQPKIQFLNLKRPKDPKLEQLKKNQIQQYLHDSEEQIGETEELDKKSKLSKNHSIILQNQELASNSSEFAIPSQYTDKNINRSPLQKGEALRNFTIDFGKASTIRYQSSATSTRSIDPSINFNHLLKKQKQSLLNQAHTNNISQQAALEIPKITMPYTNQDYQDEKILKPEKRAKSKNKLRHIKQIQNNPTNVIHQFKSDNDLGGFLSPIAHISENSPFNFMQASDGIKSVFNIRNEHQHDEPEKQVPKVKSFLRHMTSLRFNQINEELSESSNMMHQQGSQKDQSLNQNDDIVLSQQNSQKTSFSKKSDKHRDQNSDEIQQYPQSKDRIKKRRLIFEEQLPQILNLDKMKFYELYFPEQNYTKIITKYNSYRRKLNGYTLMKSRKRNVVRKKLAIFNKLHL